VLDPRLNRRARLSLFFAALVLGACSSGGGAKDGGAGGGGADGGGGAGGGGHGGAGGGVDAATADATTDRPADAAGDAGARDAQVDRPQYATPVAVQVPFASAPANLPAGAHARCLVSGTTITSSDTCWVVMWGRWTYWPLSYDDNRFSMLLTAYDESGNLAPDAAWPKELKGARYPWLVTVDDGAETITLDGQAASILVAWDDLRIDQPFAHVDGGGGPVDAAAFPDPIAVLVGRSSAPTPPDGAQVSCVASDHDTALTNTCWVVKWGSWTYWILSYIDNRESFMIAPYDSDGVIASAAAGWPKEEPGARYLWAISVDAAARTVTLSGQAARSVTVSWDDLRVDQPDTGRD
jgi:hypothetical protein